MQKAGLKITENGYNKDMKKILVPLLSLLALATYIQTAQAQSVDILWESNGYTPAFYQGKALWSKEGTIRLVAIPQSLGNPLSLNYKWSRNGTVLGNTNGIGQNTLEFHDSVISKPQTFKIEIVSPTEATLAESSLTLVPQVPGLLIYEYSPLYGTLFNKEVSAGYAVTENEVEFSAVPLFFSATSPLQPSLRYSWQSGGGIDGTQPHITYRVPEETTGRHSITLKVSESNTLLQTAQRSFLVEFNHDAQ